MPVLVPLAAPCRVSGRLQSRAEMDQCALWSLPFEHIQLGPQIGVGTSGVVRLGRVLIARSQDKAAAEQVRSNHLDSSQTASGARR